MRAEPISDGWRLVAEEDLTSEHASSQRQIFTDCLLAASTSTLILALESVREVDGRGLALLTGLAASCRSKSVSLRLEGVRPELQYLLSCCELPIAEPSGPSAP